MSYFNGKKLKIEIFGESHSENVGAKVFNFPTMTFDNDKLLQFLKRRKANNGIFSTSRIENDIPIFTNVNNNKISGDFSFIIKNNNVKSKDYNSLYGKPRPSHADYVSYLKDKTLDFSGGGRFSGRLTAPLCVIGELCLEYLESLGIKVCAYISKIGNVNGLSYKDRELTFDEVIKNRENEFPSLTNKKEMLDEIKLAKINLDSVGGKIECLVFNFNSGIGDNLFSGLEGKIAQLLYSIPAVKGVEFGLGFDFSTKCASQVNDELYFDENKNVKFYSNNNGGINGGISNGNTITMGVAFKPTPSIYKEQKTVDLVTKENTTIKIEGRHDSCIVVRAVPAIESAVAIALLDELL